MIESSNPSQTFLVSSHSSNENLPSSGNYTSFNLVEVNGRTCIQKVIDKRKGFGKRKSIDRERRICERIKENQSPYLIKIYKCEQLQHKVMITMEYYKYDLQAYLLQKWENFQVYPEERIRVFLHILYGLTDLEEAHRDLKPKNIMVEKKGKKIFCRIGDFGDSKIIKSVAESKTGTCPYRAPEMFEKDKYDKKIDIWSLGNIIYQLYHGKNKCDQLKLQFPFKENLLDHQIDEYYNKHIYENSISISKATPPLLRHLIRSMLQINPSKRISLTEIYQILYTRQSQLFQLFQDRQVDDLKSNFIQNFMKMRQKEGNLAWEMKEKQNISSSYHMFIQFFQPKIYQIKKHQLLQLLFGLIILLQKKISYLIKFCSWSQDQFDEDDENMQRMLVSTKIKIKHVLMRKQGTKTIEKKMENEYYVLALQEKKEMYSQILKSVCGGSGKALAEQLLTFI